MKEDLRKRKRQPQLRSTGDPEKIVWSGMEFEVRMTISYVRCNHIVGHVFGKWGFHAVICPTL